MTDQPPAPPPKKPAKIMLTVRVAAEGKQALGKIAAGLNISESDAHRLALKEFAEKHRRLLR